jgi:hypothetical protein
MPQLWMTYEELGELFYGDAATARDHVIANQWERRRCSDGVTRAVVPPNAMLEFMLAYIARERGHIDDQAVASGPLLEMKENEQATSGCPIWSKMSDRNEGLNPSHIS